MSPPFWTKLLRVSKSPTDAALSAEVSAKAPFASDEKVRKDEVDEEDAEAGDG